VLLTALQEFSGTLVFVSHDRYFIDKLATRIFEVESGRITVFPGNYEDYLWRKQAAAQVQTRDAPPESAPQDGLATAGTSGALSLPPMLPAKTPKASSAGGRMAKPDSTRRAAERRLNPIKLRQMKERREAIELEVTKLEAEIADYEAALANFVSAEETKTLGELLEARRTDLNALLAEWEEVGRLIEINS
jgi:ATP-binding cassette, subfamily F, member 3